MNYHFLSSIPWLLFLLITIYWLCLIVRSRTGWAIINPVVIGTATLIIYLKLTQVSYIEFEQAGRLISFWLQPAVVCLAVPLYQQWSKIKKQWIAIISAQVIGSIVGIVSGVWFAYWLGASKEISMSLAAKSVTMPIALEITKVIDGIPAIVSAGVILAGALGQSFGYWLLHRSWIKNPISQALAQGTGSHAMGIAASLDISKQFAAYATVGLIFNGILTAFITPFLIIWMGFGQS
ncbi:LrgB family protein [Suttonella ornithocola]|uniref:Inner membrane protein yohK n=1 Tax=Suttonella ornithocola TaxID=279832 RepID=A0A380MUV3_9GAMM|nr:LrgB family protein [Suttonella ornithocola]SUO95693.1 Inner membrane protein yohK [Suttonella ornithocola]